MRRQIQEVLERLERIGGAAVAFAGMGFAVLTLSIAGAAVCWGLAFLMGAKVLLQRHRHSPAEPQLPARRPRGVGEADWLASRLTGRAPTRARPADPHALRSTFDAIVDEITAPRNGFEVEAVSEMLASGPNPRHAVCLRVTNRDDQAQFVAQVTAVGGAVMVPVTPWTIRWRESPDAALVVDRDAGALLDLLEVIPMGREPISGPTWEPGLMVGRRVGGDVEMRLAANSTADITANELGLDIAIANRRTGEGHRYWLGVGIENELNMPPRLRLLGPNTAHPELTP